MQTELLSIPHPKLAGLLDEERVRQEPNGGKKAIMGSMTVGDAMQQRSRAIENDASLKQSTREYYGFLLMGLKNSWPD